MAAYTGFGATLRDARERRGYDLATAARRLRIRPDILQAIENADFARMPPRGYARNMVNAYARFVGLNPTDVTRMYLDEAHEYQQGRARGDAGAGFDMGGSSRRGARRDARGRERGDGRSSSRTRGGGAPARQPRGARSGEGRAARGSWGSRSGNQTSMPSTQFTNFYSGPKAPNTLRSKLPFLIGGAVILIALIVVLSMVLGNRQPAAETTPMPISGLTDTSDPVTETPTASTMPQQQEPAAVAPDKVVFSYAVASGEAAYIEVYEDGAPVPSVAETVAGPAEKSFDVTGTLKFVTSNPENVTLILADETVSADSLTDTGGGVYTYTVDFAAYLETWKQAHGAGDASSSSVAPSAGTATAS